MKRFLCPQLPEPHQPVLLPKPEAKHATHVLRLENGDQVEAMDGKGRAVIARLRIGDGPIRLEYVERLEVGHLASQEVSPIRLEMAVLKGEAMEWVVEKSVELGVRTFVPVLTAHTVVQVKHKGPEAFQARWQKIADQALKQCGRLERMEVHLPTPLEQLLSEVPSVVEKPRLWCDEGERESAPRLGKWLSSLSIPLEELRLLIGPEGGFSRLERELLEASHVQKMSLGPVVLRAETAALYVVAVARALALDNLAPAKARSL